LRSIRYRQKANGAACQLLRDADDWDGVAALRGTGTCTQAPHLALLVRPLLATRRAVGGPCWCDLI
jgi:hypothetical protein